MLPSYPVRRHDYRAARQRVTISSGADQPHVNILPQEFGCDMRRDRAADFGAGNHRVDSDQPPECIQQRAARVAGPQAQVERDPLGVSAVPRQAIASSNAGSDSGMMRHSRSAMVTGISCACPPRITRSATDLPIRSLFRSTISSSSDRVRRPSSAMTMSP